MSEAEKKEGQSLTSGFTTVAEIRRKEDVHESVYGEKRLLIPTLILIACGILGFIISVI